MSTASSRTPLKKKGRGKCQKMGNAKEDLSYIWNNSKYSESKQFVCEINSADTLEAQICSLKDISKKIVCESSCYDKKLLALDFLFELYFTLPVNSSLRSPLIRILSSLPDTVNTMIQTIVTERFAEKISAAAELEEIMDLTTILFGCIENSMIKYFCAGNFKNILLNFLETSLIKCHNYLLEEVPPTKKLVIINCIHNSARCAITLLQKCSPIPTENFYFTAKKLLTEEQLPTDTRSNCGMLYVLLYKCLNYGNKWDQFVYESDELSHISQLCVISGLLNTLKSDELKTVIKWKNSDIALLEGLFNKILEIEESNPADSSLILGVSRCVHLVSKSLLNLPELLTENLLNIFLTFLWIHLEHYIDAVRHIATSTLTNIVSIGKCEGKKNIFDKIAEETSRMPDEKRCKHNGINTLIGHVPVNDLLKKSPLLIEKLLTTAECSSSVDQVVMTYQSLMKQHFKESPNINEWLNLWIDPLLATMAKKPNDALEHILTNAIKLNPEIIHHVASLGSLKDDGNHKTIGVILICMRTSRKYGLSKFNETDENWKGLLSYNLLRKCISHRDVEIRMSSFSLLVECQKSTEHFTKKEFDLFKLIFSCNINNQCPAIRQKTLALVKKFLSRFNESYHSLLRASNKVTQLSDSSKELTDHKLILIDYNEFKIWLVNFAIENIFPGANFSRRGTSLNIIMLCHEFGYWNADVFTKHNVEVLLKCLLDPYEENKIIAKNLLSVMPLDKILFKDGHYVKLYLRSAVKMASSIRPPDSISAAYFITLLNFFPQVTEALVEERLIEVNSADSPFLITFIVLSVILDELEKELAVADKSILKAASSAPMYGHIFVIRQILQGIKYRSLVDSFEWKQMISRIINTAFKCNEVVACVVNNSSPEGHLPMDFNCDNKLLAEEENNTETPVTAQMVLLCSWRTVKEVSLLLGEIVEQLSSFKETVLISEEEIIRIGNHLMNLLLETKHRGAFEQAYLGFCKLAGSLWRCPIGNLHELPLQWLTSTLDEISTNEKLSATRRSAGIPFIIQGLVCSELQLGSSKCLITAFNLLFDLLNSAEASTDARTHALNILRALFRHHMLGEMVGPYVAQGLTVAINGFNSGTWAERNSSTLLLSALMVRIFGVPRSRTERISWKNKLTGRIFFQRYPTLYSELLKHLKLASIDNLYPATYPVLLILGRLYPSPLEGTDSNLQLNTFIPFVSECASSSILKTRTLAASAMVALISPHMYIDYINSLFQDVSNSQNENRSHGLLLQVIKLLRHSSNLPEEYLIERNLSMNKWFSEVTKLLKYKKHCYLVKECCLKIVINCLSTCYQYISFQNLENILKILELELFEQKKEFINFDFTGLSGFLAHAAVVLLLISYFKKSISDFSNRLYLCLKHEMYEVVSSALDFVSFMLNNESRYDPDVNDVDSIELITSYNKEFSHYLMNDLSLCKIFIYKLKHPCHHEDLVKLLNSGKNLQLIYEMLLEENICIINFFSAVCEEGPAILGKYVIHWISSYVSHKEEPLFVSLRYLLFSIQN
ncbi:thyroid adenoma-associated protein homolog isoform X3 [Rhodnius prolixus]|uniref:thyroid adenoma-associated protein homolog isoform X3 n=1 Tax=Rhodnius prolixus TaxID=13249 RepID=UPI003D18E731